MGSPGNEPDRGSDEVQHKVTLSSFEPQEAAVTQEAFTHVMHENPSYFKETKHCPESHKELDIEGQKIPVCPNLPVEKVTWDQAEQFAHKLSEEFKSSGYTFDLLTEAQQEYENRGGTTTAYVSGKNSSSLGDYVWYSANANGQTHPVKSKKANHYGVYRSSVWEWSKDWYGTYPTKASTDPTGPISGSNRVIRGCGWDFDAGSCRSARRGINSPGSRSTLLGFRVLRTR